jgi:hypothetical protein
MVSELPVGAQWRSKITAVAVPTSSDHAARSRPDTAVT